MNFDDELHQEETETGSDDLLSADHLRLPDSASVLVRLHAVRAWLQRRTEETQIEIGEAALALQEAAMEEQAGTRLRRREYQIRMERIQQQQKQMQEAQQHLEAFEEARALLEENIAHTTSSERSLVEYYLSLDNIMQERLEAGEDTSTPWFSALSEVQHRIEQVGMPNEGDE